MYKKLIKYVTVALVLTTASAVLADVQLADVKSKFDVTLYGYIKLDASYDTHKTQGDLAFFVLPEVDGQKDDEFNMTARQTRFGLKIGGPDLYDGKLSAKIEMDFYGQGSANNKADLRMRLAYLQWKNDMFEVSAGQRWETFITVIPKTVDFSTMNYAGMLGFRRPQFRVAQTIGPFTWKLAASRTIGQDMDGLGQDDGADSGMPSVQWNLIAAPEVAGRKPVVSFSGAYGKETVDVENEDSGEVKVDDKDFDSWLVQGSLKLPIVDMLTLQGAVWTGENIDNYYGGVGNGVNLTKDTAVGAKGGFAQLLVTPLQPLTLGLAYGIDDPDDGDLNAGNRSKNERWNVNGFYSLNADLVLMLEYANIKTSYQDADDATDNRVQAAVQYNF
jgi:hypothetical protein